MRARLNRRARVWGSACGLGARPWSSNRSVIVSMASIIEVTILSKDVDTVLTADGQIQVEGAPNDRIRIHAEQDQVTFLNTPNNPFFSILRQKMQWSGSNLHHSNS